MKKGMIDTMYDNAVKAYEKAHGIKVTTEEQAKEAIREMFRAIVPELAND